MNPARPVTTDRMILVGLRGSGKTACGRSLAQLTGSGFVDTDDLVEREAGLTVTQIFQSEGEAGFRERECRAVAGLVDRPVPEVVATGGGVVLADTNRHILARLGILVYLRAAPEVLARRVAAAADSERRRPPLSRLDPVAEMEALTMRREPLYLELAHFTVESDGSPDRVAQKLLLIWQSQEDQNAARHR